MLSRSRIRELRIKHQMRINAPVNSDAQDGLGLRESRRSSMQVRAPHQHNNVKTIKEGAAWVACITQRLWRATRPAVSSQKFLDVLAGIFRV